MREIPGLLQEVFGGPTAIVYIHISYFPQDLCQGETFLEEKKTMTSYQKYQWIKQETNHIEKPLIRGFDRLGNPFILLRARKKQSNDLLAWMVFRNSDVWYQNKGNPLYRHGKFKMSPNLKATILRLIKGEDDPIFHPIRITTL